MAAACIPFCLAYGYDLPPPHVYHLTTVDIKHSLRHRNEWILSFSTYSVYETL